MYLRTKKYRHPIKINFMNKFWQLKITAVLILTSFALSAQDSSDWVTKPTVTISGFTDIFYVYDFLFI